MNMIQCNRSDIAVNKTFYKKMARKYNRRQIKIDRYLHPGNRFVQSEEHKQNFSQKFVAFTQGQVSSQD